MNSDPITVHVKLSYADAYKVQISLLAWVFRKYIYGSVVFVAFYAAAWIFLMIRAGPENEDWTQMLPKAESPFVWWLGAFALIFVVSPLLSARRIASDPRFASGTTYMFTDTGIHTESAVAKSDSTWKAILRANETGSMFLLFTGKNMAWPVPKRFIAQPEDVRNLREMLRRNVAVAKLQA